MTRLRHPLFSATACAVTLLLIGCQEAVDTGDTSANDTAESADTSPADAAPDALNDQGEDGGAHDAPDAAAPSLLGASGVQLSLSGAGGALMPQVRTAEGWVAAATCAPDGADVVCPLDGVGTARLVSPAPSVVQLVFTASTQVRVEGLALDGVVNLPGARAWISNGFQSWSASGNVALGPRPTAAATERALASAGSDEEVLREGDVLSWWHTAVGGGNVALVTGVLGAERWRCWTQQWQDLTPAVTVRLGCGDAGAAFDLEPGDTIASERWYLALTEDAAASLLAYGAALPSRRSSVVPAADAGWNSWYELWDTVDETAVRANATLALAALDPFTEEPLRIVVDDGWQLAWGDWLPNAKFPSGLDGLATDLHADGFRTGVWLAPLLVHHASRTAQDHPEWLVADAAWRHVDHGRMNILDVTHPGAEAHLRELIARIVGWGYDLLKIDFLFAGSYEGGRHQPLSGMQAYRRALQIIRDAAGPDVLLLAVGAPGPPSFEFVDAWRVGGDIAVNVFGPRWPFVANQARSVAARWYLCEATLCDADPPLQRDLTEDEVVAGAWAVAFAGGALFLSDDLRELPEDRRSWGLTTPIVTLATSGVPARPEQLFPAAATPRLANAIGDVLEGVTTHVVPVVWRAPDGTRVALNASDELLQIEGTLVPPHAARVLAPAGGR